MTRHFQLPLASGVRKSTRDEIYLLTPIGFFVKYITPIGVSPSGKATDSDSVIPRFES